MSRGHSESACSTGMLAWAGMSGSLKPSRYGPALFAWASFSALTLPEPHTIGTNSISLGTVMPSWWVSHV